MTYSKQLSSKVPGLFLFLLDQSASMQGSWGANGGSKADQVADVLNRFLRDLTLRCAKGADIKKRIHIGVLGYGSGVNSAFMGTLAGRDTADIAEVAANPARVEERSKKESDGVGGIIETTVKFPVWVDSSATGGGTPMKEAFIEAKNIVSNWLASHPGGYPPIVINVTDGEYTSGTPAQDASALKGLSTTDGDVLLFNIHISSNSAAPVFFPSGSNTLSDQYAKELFEMSSELPDAMIAKATELYPGTSKGSRGFAFNGDLVTLVNFLDIGSTVDAAAE
jgi:hypothetical protein